jgi:hypothetical protein
MQPHPVKNWQKIAEYLEMRTEAQCQHRWQKVLNPDLVKGPWTPEVGGDDDIIVVSIIFNVYVSLLSHFL